MARRSAHLGDGRRRSRRRPRSRGNHDKGFCCALKIGIISAPIWHRAGRAAHVATRALYMRFEWLSAARRRHLRKASAWPALLLLASPSARASSVQHRSIIPSSAIETHKRAHHAVYRRVAFCRARASAAISCPEISNRPRMKTSASKYLPEAAFRGGEACRAPA